jgi:citrate synthase
MKWLDTETSCERLGIKRASLYAYVSRGLVRARASESDPRASLYSATDIDRLFERKAAGRRHQSIAEGAIGWGEPILESQIATVHGGRLIYRGQDGVNLSQRRTLEEVAAVLWGKGGLPKPLAQTERVTARESKSAGFIYLANMAAMGLPNAGRPQSQMGQEAADLLEGLANAMALGAEGNGAHEKLARLWNLNSGQRDIVRRALVLMADHELNPSSFAARVAASTGASLAASAMAGYATLTGPYHGEAAARALDFLTQAHTLGPVGAVAAVLERAQTLPGIGHRIYPDGDPRAQALLVALRPHPILTEAISLAETTWAGRANIDMALAAMTIQLKLPKTAPFTLFAVARMAGWLAHAREQALSGGAIRPRARYTGTLA